MLNADQIAHAIIAGQFNIEDLRTINSAIKVAWDSAERRTRLAFRKNDKVWSEKYGAGVVKTVGPKNLIITLTNGQELRASPSLITKVA